MNKLRDYCAITLLLLPLMACADDEDIDGLWMAYKRFGPDVHGPILIDAKLARAEAGPFIADVTKDDDTVRFELPDGKGKFLGKRDGDIINGHWIQPPPLQIGQNMASPVKLTLGDNGNWQGTISPRASEYTFYLPVQPSNKGVYKTFLRNPDRNLGVFNNVNRIEKSGEKLSFVGAFRMNADEYEIAAGTYDEQHDVLTMMLPPWRGGTYDFRRVAANERSHFYARAEDGQPWTYLPPPQLDDGWQTATLADAGIDERPIREMIDEQIRTVDDHVSSHRVHGILIARNGKLVLEEYFHGFDRNTPHDTRSAAKSMASMLVGAAMQNGLKVGPDTSVYDTLRGKSSNRESRKQAMTMEHLLTMTSGLYCDDNDSSAPGNENTLQEQEDEPDWYKYTLDVPMAYDPGEEAIYCSANSNLIGAVLAASTGQSLLDIFSNLVARPLGIDTYFLGLQPTGEPYLGGGSQWLPRDFMKLGQVMLNGGTWNGQRIVSEDWAVTSTSPQVVIGDRAYGYQWWITDYPYRDGTVRAFFAAGNGGQIVMGVPDLDLLIAFYGGNYSDRVLFRAQEVLIPEFILKAVN